MSIARTSLGGMATNAATQALSFLAGILVTRALGPEPRGTFFLLLAFAGVVVNLGTLGLPNANTVFLAQQRYTLGTLHANSVVAALACSGGVWVLFLLLQGWLRASVLAGIPGIYLLWSLLQLPLLFYENFWTGLAIGAGQVGRYNVIQVGKAVSAAAAVLVLYAAGRLDLVGVMGIWTGTNLLSAIWMFRALPGHQAAPPTWRPLREALGFGMRVHLGGVATNLWQRFDSFYLNATHGMAAVGEYSIALTLTEGLWRLVGPVVNAIQQPIVSQDAARATRTTQRTLRHVAFLLLVLGGALGISAPWIVPALYGPAFAPAAPAVQLLVPGTVGIGLGMVASVYFVGVLNRGGFLSLLAWLNAVVNVILCLALIPRWGMLGAAQASALTYVFGTVVVLVLFRRATSSRWSDFLVLGRGDLADYHALLHELQGRCKP